jgi:hypothetical protein
MSHHHQSIIVEWLGVDDFARQSRQYLVRNVELVSSRAGTPVIGVLYSDPIHIMNNATFNNATTLFRKVKTPLLVARTGVRRGGG